MATGVRCLPVARRPSRRSASMQPTSKETNSATDAATQLTPGVNPYSYQEIEMYIGGGLLGAILVIALIVFVLRRV